MAPLPTNSLYQINSSYQLEPLSSTYTWNIYDLSRLKKCQTKLKSSSVRVRDLEWWLELHFFDSEKKTEERQCDTLIFSIPSSCMFATERIETRLDYKILYGNQLLFCKSLVFRTFTSESSCQKIRDPILQKYLEKSKSKNERDTPLVIKATIEFAYFPVIETSNNFLKFEEEKFALSQLSDFEKLLNCKFGAKYSDFRVICGAKTHLLHKSILGTKCEFFANFFKTKPEAMSYELEDVDQELFFELLRFIYGARVENFRAKVRELGNLAVRFGVKGLEKLCEEFFSQKGEEVTKTGMTEDEPEAKRRLMKIIEVPEKKND